MTLRGARVALSATKFKQVDVEIGSGDRIIDLSGHVILPGLINAHDHLEFSLYPRLGRGPWPNATEWARDVYRPDESPVREHRAVPRRTRLYWGGLKNLLSGVTTVCHHNPYEARVFTSRFPVRVIRDFGWAHSLAFSPSIRVRRNLPFVIHAGESTDGSAVEEFRELDRIGAITNRSALVHGVGFTRDHWRTLRARGAAVIACPSSNLFSLRETLSRAAFRSGVPIALGTDSAITAQTDLLDELRVARATWNLSTERLYSMVTEIPASIFGIRAPADHIVLRDIGASPAETLLAARRIEMSIIDGRIRLATRRFATPGLNKIKIAGRGTFFVDADVAALYNSAVSILGEPLRLAGKRVSL